MTVRRRPRHLAPGFRLHHTAVPTRSAPELGDHVDYLSSGIASRPDVYASCPRGGTRHATRPLTPCALSRRINP
jgi:hypothetical protein